MNYLLDVLAVIVGFAAVMLLLSLLVTAVTQVVQNMLSLRPRNLRQGIQAMVESLLATVDEDPIALESKATLLRARAAAALTTYDDPAHACSSADDEVRSVLLDLSIKSEFAMNMIRDANKGERGDDLVELAESCISECVEFGCEATAKIDDDAPFKKEWAKVVRWTEDIDRALKLLCESIEFSRRADAASANAEIRGSEAIRIARDLLEVSRFAPRPVNTGVRGMMSRVFTTAPDVSWVEPEELQLRLEQVGIELSEPTREKFPIAFERMSDYTSKRFLVDVRCVTILSSFLVAFVFQVSTPELITQLWTTPEIRQRNLALAESLAQTSLFITQVDRSYEEVSEEALAELQRQHSDLAGQIEQAAGMGDRDDIIAELDIIFAEDNPDMRESVIEEYEQLLDDLHGAEARAALSQVQSYLGELAGFSIVPWPKGWAYYRSPGNWVGVGMTTVLLTLGAPFWFELLRNVASLRDALQPRKKPDGNGSDSMSKG